MLHYCLLVLALSSSVTCAGAATAVEACAPDAPGACAPPPLPAPAAQAAEAPPPPSAAALTLSALKIVEKFVDQTVEEALHCPLCPNHTCNKALFFDDVVFQLCRMWYTVTDVASFSASDGTQSITQELNASIESLRPFFSLTAWIIHAYFRVLLGLKVFELLFLCVCSALLIAQMACAAQCGGCCRGRFAHVRFDYLQARLRPRSQGLSGAFVALVLFCGALASFVKEDIKKGLLRNDFLMKTFWGAPFQWSLCVALLPRTLHSAAILCKQLYENWRTLVGFFKERWARVSSSFAKKMGRLEFENDRACRMGYCCADSLRFIPRLDAFDAAPKEDVESIIEDLKSLQSKDPPNDCARSCWELAIFADKGKEAKLECVKKGAVRLIVEAMALDGESSAQAKVNEWGCNALSALSYAGFGLNSRDGQRACLSDNAVHAVFCALRVHAVSAAVCEAACRALVNFTFEDVYIGPLLRRQCVAEGVLPIVQALQTHVASPNVCVFASLALANIGRSNPAFTASIVAAGAAGALHAARDHYNRLHQLAAAFAPTAAATGGTPAPQPATPSTPPLPSTAAVVNVRRASLPASLDAREIEWPPQAPPDAAISVARVVALASAAFAEAGAVRTGAEALVLLTGGRGQKAERAAILRGLGVDDIDARCSECVGAGAVPLLVRALGVDGGAGAASAVCAALRNIVCGTNGAGVAA